MIKLSGVKYESFVDAAGVSCVLFVSGCCHNCYMCHSPQTHDFNYGLDFDESMINTINSEISKRPFLNALVLSGGDPMYSANELINIIPKIKIPNNNIWCYTGFTIDEIVNNKDMFELLKCINVLVDGRYEHDKRDVTLPFRGSTNQRVIDVQKTLQSCSIVIYNA